MTTAHKTPNKPAKQSILIRDPDLNEELQTIANELGEPWDRTKLARAIIRDAIECHKSNRRRLPPTKPFDRDRHT